LGQKGILFHLKLSISMPSLEIFWHKEEYILYFLTWSIGSYLEKYIEYLEKVNGHGPLQPSDSTLEAPTGQISPTRARPRATIPTALVIPSGPPRCTATVVD
jgi:hypothetical protein